MQRAVRTVKYELTILGRAYKGKLPQVLLGLAGVPRPPLCHTGHVSQPQALPRLYGHWAMCSSVWRTDLWGDPTSFLDARVCCSNLPDLGENSPKDKASWASCSRLLYKPGVEIQALPKTQLILFSQWIQTEVANLDYLTRVRNVLFLAMLICVRPRNPQRKLWELHWCK